MKISIAVMAHRSREKFFLYLREKLGNIPFSIDEIEGRPGHIKIWENRKRALRMCNPNSDFSLIIQDDAIICENFIEKAEKIIEQNGEYAYSFYYGRRGNKKSEAEQGLKDGRVISNWLTWGLAICLPVKLIGEMIAFCDALTGPDDTRMAKFLVKKNIKVYYPIPSLVDHRTDEKSLVGNALSPGRKAWFFIDNIK